MNWTSQDAEAAQNRKKSGQERMTAHRRHKDVGEGAWVPQNEENEPSTIPALITDPGPWHVGRWRISVAPGVSYHRILCQAPLDADAAHFLAYLKDYRKP